MMDKLNWCINLLKNYNTIWDKICTDIKKQFDGKPVYKKKYLNTKKKSYDEQVTHFDDREIPKVDSNHTCLAIKKNEIYYP